MKTKKFQKNNPKLLQEQSSKIQQRLQSLRQQVQKKKNDQLNKKSHDVNLKGFLQSKPNITYPSQSSLSNLLAQLKIDSHEQVFREKGINTIQQLLQLNPIDVDDLKQLPVGYRIKLRIFLNEKNKQSSKLQIQQQLSKKQISKDIEIQQIIKNRGPKKFIPIERFNQQQFQLSLQLKQQEQQKMINSLNNAFNPRLSIIKKTPNKQNKSVHWSQEVQQMQKQFILKSGKYQHHKYPKQISPKGIFYKKNSKQFCWNCLKFVNSLDQFKIDQRIFCSSKCKLDYQKSLVKNQQNQKIEQVQQQDQVVLVDLSL